MRRSIEFTVLFLTSMLITAVLFGCTKKIAYSEKAEYDKFTAAQTVQDLKDSPIIFILPTESKKEKLLAKIGKDKQLERLIAKRDYVNTNIMTAFVDSFTFSEVYFVPDSIFKKCNKGDLTSCFVSPTGDLMEVDQIDLSDPYKMIVNDYRSIEFIRGTALVPNPFPNNFYIGGYSGNHSFIMKLMPFLKNKNWSLERMKVHVGRMNRVYLEFAKGQTKYHNLNEPSN